MRITNTMMMNQALYDLDALKQKYYKAQSAVNGRSLERPSEDPHRVVEAMDLAGSKMRIQRSMRAGEDAREWLSMAETSMTSMIDQLQSARELAVQAGSPSSLSPDSREALAVQTLAIRDSLVRELNYQHRDQYIFAGWNSSNRSEPPLSLAPDGSVVSEANAGQVITRDLAPGLSVTVNVTSDELLAGGDVLRALTEMAANLREGKNQLVSSERLGEIDKVLSHVSGVRSSLGVRAVEVEKYQTYAQDSLFHIEERLTNITGTDLETAVVRMTEAQTAYQAALAAFAKALPTSLIDYMLR